MANHMHIADDVTDWFKQHGLLTGWALCGRRMTPEKMAQSPNAPTCPKCAKKAGWTK